MTPVAADGSPEARKLLKRVAWHTLRDIEEALQPSLPQRARRQLWGCQRLQRVGANRSVVGRYGLFVRVTFLASRLSVQAVPPLLRQPCHKSEE